MAKKVVATLSRGNIPRLTKFIQMKKSATTGAYVFRSRMIPPEMIQEILAKKIC